MNKEYAYKTVRVYGKPKKINKNYFEVPYTEYIDEKAHSTGTEDFSLDRLRSFNSIRYDVKRFTGNLNRGGQKIWEDIEWFNFLSNNQREARKIIRNTLKERYGNDYKITSR